MYFNAPIIRTQIPEKIIFLLHLNIEKKSYQNVLFETDKVLLAKYWISLTSVYK